MLRAPMTTSPAALPSTDGSIVLGAAFAAQLTAVLPRILGTPGALPDDWDHRATTYDLTRFDSDDAFARRFEKAVAEILASDLHEASALRAVLTACGLPFDYARLGQPLSTVFELLVQSRAQAARCFSFASRTKSWLSVIESPRRTLPVRVYAVGALPISDELRGSLVERGVELHENFRGTLGAKDRSVLTVLVADAAPPGSLASQHVDGETLDALVFPVENGSALLLTDPSRIDPRGIQLIRKRTVSALLAADAHIELARAGGLDVPTWPEATAATCEARLRALFPEVVESAIFCTGLAAEAAVFRAAVEVAGPGPVTVFYAQNGYGGTGQLLSELLPRECPLVPAPLAVLGTDAAGRALTLVDRIVQALDGLAGAPACVFLETPTNPELQAHDFEGLMRALRAYAARWGRTIPVLVDTTLAPLYPVFAKDFARDWPFVLVKSGSKYFTKGKTTLGVVATAETPIGRAILARTRALGADADSFGRPAQLAALAEGLTDLVPRMAEIATHTERLAAGLRASLRARGHDILLYAISAEQAKEGLASGLLSFYLPPAPTTHADLVDEFVDDLLVTAPRLVKSRVSYGQSTGGGRPDVFYVINPQESTQGSLSGAVKDAQKRNNVQICRISVPELADVDGLLAAMEGFFDRKYGPRR